MEVDFKASTKLRVRYGETDQMGYCYYGNYAQYFEVGRVEAMRALGMTYRSLEERGVMLPVVNFEVNYKFPALYDDELLITTTISELQGPRLTFHYEITKDSGELICTAKTTLVFVSKKSKRPIAPPDDFITLLSEYKAVK